MTTISITLENPSLVTTLKKLIANLNGVVGFKVSKTDTLSSIPNRTTKAAMKAAKSENLKQYTSAEALLTDLYN